MSGADDRLLGRHVRGELERISQPARFAFLGSPYGERENFVRQGDTRRVSST
jgi:hypothetical protein